MKTLLKQTLPIITLMLMSSPLYAMGAYGWIANIENEFYKSDFAKLTKSRGTDKFDDLTDKQATVTLDCGKALYLYGGRDALKTAFKNKGKGFIVATNCTDPDKLGVFVSTVDAGLKTKQIIMITPADSKVVNVVGEEYLYKFKPLDSVKKNLTESLITKELVRLIDNLEK